MGKNFVILSRNTRIYVYIIYVYTYEYIMSVGVYIVIYPPGYIPTPICIMYILCIPVCIG